MVKVYYSLQIFSGIISLMFLMMFIEKPESVVYCVIMIISTIVFCVSSAYNFVYEDEE